MAGSEQDRVKTANGLMTRNLNVQSIQDMYQKYIPDILWSQFRIDLEDMAECFYSLGVKREVRRMGRKP